MRVTTTKSKNAESFYITQSYTNSDGKSTSKIVQKLGTLQDLCEKLGTDRDGVMASISRYAGMNFVSLTSFLS